MRTVKVNSKDHVSNLGCGQGNSAITARKVGAKVVGLNITPKLLDRAKQEASIAEEGDIKW